MLSGRMWPVWSGCHGGQADEGIIADGSNAFQGHVAGPLDGPLEANENGLCSGGLSPAGPSQLHDEVGRTR
jgi:hypothetical protein